MKCDDCGAPKSMCGCVERPSRRTIKRVVFQWADKDRPRPIVFLVRDFIPAHCLVIIAGREGSGKSTLAELLISDGTKGHLCGDMAGQMLKALVMGTEDGWHSRWIPRLHATGASLERVARDPSFLTHDADGNDVLDLVAISDPDNLALLAEAMKAEGISILYLDHLGEALRAGLNYNSYGDMTEALKVLNKWAEVHSITVIGGWHFSKGGGNVSDKVIGSVGLMTSARCVLIVAEDPEEAIRLVAVSKSNDIDLSRPAKSFLISPTTVSIEDEDYEITVASGLSDHDHLGSGKEYVQRLIDLADNRERPTTEGGNFLAADGWLADYFNEHGPTILRKQVLAWAEPAGYSERTIERAFFRLGGVSKKVGREAQWELTPTPPSQGRSRESTDDDGDPTSVKDRQPPSTPSLASTPGKGPLLARDGGVRIKRDVPTGTVIDLHSIAERLDA